MQWHPLFARLLRPLVEEYYDVQTNVPVGDLPRQGDIVLLRRTSSRRTPFRGIWRHLTPWNVLEFKGPTVDPRLYDPDLLVEVGLGVERRLNEEQERQRQPRRPRGEVSFWYIANHLGRRFLAEVEHVFGQAPAPLGDGLWRLPCMGRHLFLVSNDVLPVDRESVPLHLVSKESPEREQELVRTVVSQASLLHTYGSWLIYFHPELRQEIEQMAKASKKGKFQPDLRPLIEMVGLKRVHEVFPPEEVARALTPEVLAALTPEQRLAGLTSEEREHLKRLLK